MLIPHRTIPILDKKAFPFIEFSFPKKSLTDTKRFADS